MDIKAVEAMPCREFSRTRKGREKERGERKEKKERYMLRKNISPGEQLTRTNEVLG